MERPPFEFTEGVEKDSNECCNIFGRILRCALGSGIIEIRLVCTQTYTYKRFSVFGITPAYTDRLVNKENVGI